jgi:hypothetical protein
LPGIVDRPFDTDDRIQAQQSDCDRGVVQIHVARSKGRDDFGRQGINVDFQADSQCGGGVNRRDGVLYPQDVRPQGLVAERVVTEDRLSLSRMTITPFRA